MAFSASAFPPVAPTEALEQVKGAVNWCPLMEARQSKYEEEYSGSFLVV